MFEDHVELSFVELTLMCPPTALYGTGFHKFQWRKNRRAEDWRPLPTGRDHAHWRVAVMQDKGKAPAPRNSSGTRTARRRPGYERQRRRQRRRPREIRAGRQLRAGGPSCLGVSQRYKGSRQERGRDGSQVLQACVTWELGHRQECLCYWKSPESAKSGKIKISRFLKPNRSRWQEIKPIFLDVINVTGNGDANHRSAWSRRLI